MTDQELRDYAADHRAGRGVMATRWWTEPAWWQAVGGIAQLIATLLLLYVTWSLTDKMVRAQVDPLVTFEFSQGEKELVIGNDGVDAVVDASVTHDILVFAGPPRNTRLNSLFSGRRIPGKPLVEWWRPADLKPGDVRQKSVADVAENAGEMIRFVEEAHAKNELSTVSASERVQFYAVVPFRITYHREVDHKPYRDAKKVFVILDSEGQPAVLDGVLAASFMKAVEVPERK